MALPLRRPDLEDRLRKASLIPLLVLSGCISHGGIRPLRPLELAVGPYQEAATRAEAGSLMYEDGCLMFRNERTAARSLLVWPNGSVFNGTSVIFHQPGKSEQRIVLGEEILLEGRPVDPSWFAGAYQPFARQCPVSPFFVSRVRPAD